MLPNNTPIAPFDKALEIIACLLLLLTAGLSIYAYTGMPETIPIHFNLQGQPDDYGSKGTIFLLPVVCVFTMGMMYFILKSPSMQKFNYPRKVKPENQEKFRLLSLRLIRMIMVTVGILFLALTMEIWLIATGVLRPLGSWFFVLLLLLVFLPIGYYMIRVFRLSS